mgnify:FL=1
MHSTISLLESSDVGISMKTSLIHLFLNLYLVGLEDSIKLKQLFLIL